MSYRTGLLAVVAAPLFILSAAPADAKCTRLAFSVNDYGKDGPTKDAKDLLDKHIAEQMAAKGIAKYNVGKKDVNCELFIDLVVFDEYTCRAEANVCWNEGVAPQQKTAGDPKAVAGAPASGETKKAAVPVAKPKTEAAKIELAPGYDASEPATATAPATSNVPDAPAATEVKSDTPEPAGPPNSAAQTAETEPGIPEPPDRVTDAVETPAASSAEVASPKPSSDEPMASETGSIERFAGPRGIVPPAPVEASRAAATP